jgi:hypothetical protein
MNHNWVLCRILLPCLVVVALALLVLGCAQDNPLQPNSQQSINSPPPGITFQSWNTGYLESEYAKIKSSPSYRVEDGKLGYAEKDVKPDQQARVGGNKTLGNLVEIPAGAVSRETTITVDVVDPGFAAVDFGPSMKFNRSVSVTLSYAGTTVDPTKINIYWWDPNANAWVMISDHPAIDTHKQTVSFPTDHFSRYAWGE